MLHLVNVKEIERFHKLYRRIFNVMEELLDECLKKTENMIKQLIEIEMGYINNNHPDFIDTLTSVQSHEKQSNSQAEEDQQLRFKEVEKNGVFSKKKTAMDFLKNEVELYDSKIITQKPSREIKEEHEEEPQTTLRNNAAADATNYLQLTDIYDVSKAVSHFPRELLPQVP